MRAAQLRISQSVPPVAEALRSDVQLLESGLEAGRAKALVPKALDADDEDDRGPSDDEDSDEEVGAHWMSISMLFAAACGIILALPHAGRGS